MSPSIKPMPQCSTCHPREASFSNAEGVTQPRIFCTLVLWLRGFSSAAEDGADPQLLWTCCLHQRRVMVQM